MKFRMRIRGWAQRLGLVGPLRVPPLCEQREGESREAFLQRSLYANLAYAEAHGELGDRTRAAWFAEHLEIYVRRLRGWLMLDPPADLNVMTDLVMVRIGAQATGRELDRIRPGPAVRAAWAEVEAAIPMLARSRMEDVEQVEARVTALRAAIQAERG